MLTAALLQACGREEVPVAVVPTPNAPAPGPRPPDPTPPAALAEPPPAPPASQAPPQPTVRELDEHRVQVGPIVVDRTALELRVPGKVLRREPPLEFLAVIKDGHKGYEAVLELDSDAYELNLACLLIGLDPDNAVPPRGHFDPEVTKGDAVDVTVSFKEPAGAGERERRVDAADLIMFGKKRLPRGQWVYIGSAITAEGQYLAQLDGTAIGFVHDPSSIIEHATGITGHYGELTTDPRNTPEVGTPITLTVRKKGRPAKVAAGGATSPKRETAR